MKRSVSCVLLVCCTCFSLAAQNIPEGKIITAQGKVEYMPSLVKSWQAARLLQGLFKQDRVHTRTESKAAILFRDETQVRLNANAELVVRSLVDSKGSSSVFELLQGEGWFRTKNPSSDLHVATPSATAAIRGTEINLRIGTDNETVLTVIEGQVAFANDWGAITVNSGEEAIARIGQAPTKRVIVNPEDAVQWIIFYPTYFSWSDMMAAPRSEEAAAGFDRLRAGDPQGALAVLQPIAGKDGWARIGASMAFMELSDYENARNVLKNELPSGLEVERLSQLAAIAIASGDIGEARRLLDAARMLDPKALRALILSSTVALAQNRKDDAMAAAQAALDAFPASVSANIAAGEVTQAAFDLPLALRYYSAALSSDPKDIRALVDRARVQFGMGRRDEAGVDASTAEELAPDDPQVRSLRGFILLSSGKRKESAAEFAAAVTQDPSFGEPHLGLGLLAFKEGKTEEGLEELLIATLLDPKISLYQSYLGKAYAQVRRFTEGVAALDSAQRLDPNDPTPRLYKSHYLRDLGRFVDSLAELNAAIALNDNRAVYRSRLLLDQDFAARNVSLAETYNKVGLSAWGVSQALSSLNADFSNSGAHLFLAGLYGELPDRLQALSSEWLQFILYSPVNQNSFNSFNEYTTLFDQPRFSLSGYIEGSAPTYYETDRVTWYGLGELSTRSGNDYFTHISLLHFKYQDGARPLTPDMFGFADLEAKVALGLDTSLFFHLTYNLSEFGDSPDNTILILGSGSNTVGITVTSRSSDKNNSNTQQLFNATAGLRHDWAIGFPFTVVLQYENISAMSRDPDQPSTNPLYLLDSKLIFSWSLAGIQLQQILRLGDRYQLLVGSDDFMGTRHYENPWRAYQISDGTVVQTQTDVMDSYEQGIHIWAWNEWQLLESLHLSGALFYQLDSGHHLFLSESYYYSQLYPLVGATLDLGPHAVLRAAFFQFRSARLFAETIYPTSIAGFLLDRNEDIYTMRTEAHLALDNSLAPIFFSNHLFYRYSEYAPFALISLKYTESLGLSSDFNAVLSRNFCLSANNQVEATFTSPFTEISDLFKVRLTYTHSKGITASLTNTLIVQQFLQTRIPELKDTLADLIDADVRYDFPGKHGYASVAVTNILSQDFTLFSEALSLSSIYPWMRVTASLDLKL